MLLADVGNYLAGAGLGLTLGTNLFQVPFPATCQDAAVCIVETPGEEDEFGSGPSLDPPALERPRLSVTVRDAPQNALTCRTLAGAIRSKLNNLGPVTLGGVLYHHLEAKPVFYLSADQNERPRWVINVAVMKGDG